MVTVLVPTLDYHPCLPRPVLDVPLRARRSHRRPEDHIATPTTTETLESASPLYFRTGAELTCPLTSSTSRVLHSATRPQLRPRLYAAIPAHRLFALISLTVIFDSGGRQELDCCAVNEPTCTFTTSI